METEVGDELEESRWGRSRRVECGIGEGHMEGEVWKVGRRLVGSK